ncbi:MAG: restriction endonuclease subunit S [Bilifractor sp.]
MKYQTYSATPEAVWFHKVPAGWRATKMRELFAERNTKVSDKEYPALSVGKMGIVPQLDTAVKTDNGDNRKLICKGDFAINSRSDRKGSSGISKYDGSCSLIITVLKPHYELNGRFYHYLLRSHYFVEEFYRNGHGLVADLWTTKWDELRNIYVPVPPRAEQDQIVRYLDWQVSRINKLIHGYQKQIKLLEEELSTISSRAAIRGIREDVEYNNPHMIGFDKIPSQWKVLQNKRIFRERSDFSEKGDEILLSVSKHYGVKPMHELTEDEQYATIKPAETLVGYKKVSKGDLVMNIMRARNGSYGISDYDGIVSPAYCVYKTIIPVDSRYMQYLLKTPQTISIFEAYSYGIAEHRRRLYAPDFLRLYLPVPPYNEQVKIADFLDKKSEQIDFLTTKIKVQINLLREYRTRLISDVVTGQMDVRGIEIPDYTPEEDIEESDIEEGAVTNDAQ